MGLVLNKVLNSDSKSNKESQSRVRSVYQVPLLGFVPCFCDILRTEGNFIFAQDKPDHPFTRILREMPRSTQTKLINSAIFSSFLWQLLCVLE